MSFFTKERTYKDKWGDEKTETIVLKGRLIAFIIAIVFLVALITSSFTVIPTGYTGVRSTFGQISPDTVQNGFNWKVPFVQKISKVNNKQQDAYFATISVDKRGNKIGNYIWGETSEKVPMYMADVTVTYQINPEKSAWIYANVSNYKEALISSSIVSSALKEASVTIDTEHVTNRAYIEPAAMKSLQNALDSKYGKNTVIIIKVVINNMDFEESYNSAINARSLATKTQETQKIQNETNIAKATAEAEAKRIQAKGDADAKLIAAESEAKANKAIAQSITSDILSNRFYDKWDGVMPKYMADNGLMPIVDIGNE